MKRKSAELTYQWWVERAVREERMAREARRGVRMLSRLLLEPGAAVQGLGMAVSWHGLILDPHTITNMTLLRPTQELPYVYYSTTVLQSPITSQSPVQTTQIIPSDLHTLLPSTPLNNTFIVIHFYFNIERWTWTEPFMLLSILNQNIFPSQ